MKPRRPKVAKRPSEKGGRIQQLPAAIERQLLAFDTLYFDPSMSARHELVAQALAIGADPLDALYSAGFTEAKPGSKLRQQCQTELRNIVARHAPTQAAARKHLMDRAVVLMAEHKDVLAKLEVTPQTVLGGLVKILAISLAPSSYSENGALKALELLGKNQGLWDGMGQGADRMDPKILELASILFNLGPNKLDAALKLLAGSTESPNDGPGSSEGVGQPRH